jgi:hypothetical protein
MTQRRDLKRRVRERQARTGESYVTALRHVRGEPAEAAGAPPSPDVAAAAPSAGAIPVVELVDLSDVAASLGLTCRVMGMPLLIERVDATAMLVQLRGVLRTTAGDPAFAVLRSAVLLGERPSVARDTMRATLPSPVAHDALRFAARVRAGIGGISNNGRALAFSVAGRDGPELVVFSLWLVPPRFDRRPPTLVITSPEQLSIHTRFALEGAP